MKKRLYRSRTDRVLSGVCGGLGEYFSVDSTIVRLVWTLLFLAGGSGVLLYILAWIIIPPQPLGTKKKVGKESFEDRIEEFGKEVEEWGEYLGKRMEKRGPMLFGSILILIGLFLLINKFIPWFNLWQFWPVVLIIIGVWVLVMNRN